jgi:hypothetical protein
MDFDSSQIRVKHLLPFLLCAVVTQSLCCAAVTKIATANPSGSKLSADDWKVLQDSSRFHEVHSTCDLPPGFVALAATSLQNLARIGTPLMPLQIQLFLQNG